MLAFSSFSKDYPLGWCALSTCITVNQRGIKRPLLRCCFVWLLQCKKEKKKKLSKITHVEKITFENCRFLIQLYHRKVGYQHFLDGKSDLCWERSDVNKITRELQRTFQPPQHSSVEQSVQFYVRAGCDYSNLGPSRRSEHGSEKGNGLFPKLCTILGSSQREVGPHLLFIHWIPDGSLKLD